MGSVLSASRHRLASAAILTIEISIEMLARKNRLLLCMIKMQRSLPKQKLAEEPRSTQGAYVTDTPPSPAIDGHETIDFLASLDPVTRAWADERASQKADEKAHRLLSGPLQFQDTLAMAAGSQSKTTSASLPLLAIQSLELSGDREWPYPGPMDTDIIWDSSKGW